MAPRVIKLAEQEELTKDAEIQLSPQRKRPEVGRFLLQVDRQTKGSYATMEAAEAAGLLIKNRHPVVYVSVYDSVETSNKLVGVPANS
jgi:hypothetical protein